MFHTVFRPICFPLFPQFKTSYLNYYDCIIILIYTSFSIRRISLIHDLSLRYTTYSTLWTLAAFLLLVRSAALTVLLSISSTTWHRHPAALTYLSCPLKVKFPIFIMCGRILIFCFLIMCIIFLLANIQ